MSSQTTSIAIDAAEQRLLAASNAPADDPRCIRCGYSLIGLESRRPCPECGLLAGLSLLDGHELRHNRPRWLGSLMLGSIMLAVSFPALPLIGISAALFGAAAPGSGWRATTDWFLFGTATAFGLPPALALLGGVWLLTRRAGRQRIDGTSARKRVLLRLLAAAPLPLLAFCGLIAGGVLHTRLLDWVYSWLPWTLLILALAALIAWLFRHLKALAQRAPAPLPAADSPIIGTTLAGALVVSLLIWLVGYFDRDASMFARGPAGDLMLVLMAIVFGVGLTAAVWSIYLLVRYAVAFGKSARQARQLMRDFDASRNPQAVVYDPPP